MQRRQFLQAAAAASLLTQASPAQTAVTQPGWYDRPMRWAQLAFVEDDPGNYDPAFWLDYFRRVHADGACLSAGGCVAFYPTKIPMHYKSKWMKPGTDPFGDLVKGCRSLGMNVIARTDPHGVHQDVYDAHPDWIAVDAEGRKRRHWADKDFWVTCALGPYNFDYMTRVTEEIVTLYQVDGVFSNRWAGSGMCYCEHCRENFKAFSGLALPTSPNPQDKARHAYILWHEQRLFELWKLWDARIKAINPNASYIANAGGGALSALDMKTIGEIAPTLFADRQARRGLTPPWANGKNGKEYRATLGRKPIAGIFSVGLEEEYRWKDSVQSGDEIRLWVADGIAQGLRPWFTKFNAKPEDRRWLPVVEQIYTWHHANERYLRNETNLARVAVVYSQQTASFYGGSQAHAKVEDPALGVYQALVEARIPFEMVHDRLFDAGHIDHYKALILPNIAALSTAQCTQLREYVERGGSIIATYETSLYDEQGVQRKDFGLASLFGASYAGKREGPMQNSYLKLEKDPKTGQYHPLLLGLEDAGRIVNGAHRVLVTPATPSPLTVIPTYPDLPMEEVFARPTSEHDPGVYLNEVGRGRVIYFPWDIDRTFWEVLDVDHAHLLRNAVNWATRDDHPVTVKGQGVIDLSVWAQKDSLTVHLVNLTNPMMMKGPIREVIPLVNQKVSVQIPDSRKATRAHLLVAGQTVPFRQTGNTVDVDVPSIGIHEVVALDLT
jgi:hypothetical protein